MVFFGQRGQKCNFPAKLEIARTCKYTVTPAPPFHPREASLIRLIRARFVEPRQYFDDVHWPRGDQYRSMLKLKLKRCSALNVQHSTSTLLFLPIMPVEQPFNIYREQLSSLFHGLALWSPNPEGLYDQVAIGDVGYISKGVFIRMFNVTLPWDDESNRTLGIPKQYDLLDLDNVTIRHEKFVKREYYSRHVSRNENINNVQAASPDE